MRVQGEGGLLGWLATADAEALRRGTAGAAVSVRLDDGRELVVPGALLAERPGGGFALPLALADLPAAGGRPEEDDGGPTREGEAVAVLPVVRERLDVRTRRVPTGRVRIAKAVQSREEVVSVPLAREELRVERVPVGRPVAEPVPIRQVGETTIIPLLDEVLVVEKRLMLREELHVTRHRTVGRHEEVVTLRSERATVERLGASGDDAQGIPE